MPIARRHPYDMGGRTLRLIRVPTEQALLTERGSNRARQQHVPDGLDRDIRVHRPESQCVRFHLGNRRIGHLSPTRRAVHFAHAHLKLICGDRPTVGHRHPHALHRRPLGFDRSPLEAITLNDGSCRSRNQTEYQPGRGSLFVQTAERLAIQLILWGDSVAQAHEHRCFFVGPHAENQRVGYAAIPIIHRHQQSLVGKRMLSARGPLDHSSRDKGSARTGYEPVVQRLGGQVRIARHQCLGVRLTHVDRGIGQCAPHRQLVHLADDQLKLAGHLCKPVAHRHHDPIGRWALGLRGEPHEASAADFCSHWTLHQPNTEGLRRNVRIGHTQVL